MKYIGAIVAVLVGVGAVLLLRDATLSTHQPVDPDSQIELVLHVSTRGGEAGQTLAEMAEAQVLTCRLEVNSDPVTPLEDLGDGRFRVVLAPSMDKTDQRQFRGCLEDWTIDHVRSDVERLAEIG
ncbi:MAG: hypothetical protein QNM02_15955 [Acidimicrobiia bacterium]|nr:hypothetical protein [Acidimicrobiia bacterium]